MFADELPVVGNYEIGEMIGMGNRVQKAMMGTNLLLGSFGKVYLAHHIMTKTRVSVRLVINGLIVCRL